MKNTVKWKGRKSPDGFGQSYHASKGLKGALILKVGSYVMASLQCE